jgi:hypothetical protein
VLADGALVCSSFAGDVACFPADGDGDATLACGMPGTATAIDRDVVVAQIRIGEDGRLDRYLDGISWRRGPSGWIPEPSGPLGTFWSVARRPGLTDGSSRRLLPDLPCLGRAVPRGHHSRW